MSTDKHRYGRIAASIAVLTTTVAGIALAPSDDAAAGVLPFTTTATAPASKPDGDSTPPQVPNFANIVSRYGPAVVHIDAVAGRGSASLGSGFIVSSDGFILTNHHVIKGAEQVSVKLTDGRTFDARVVRTDPATDVAVLKVNARGLPVVRIGDPADSRTGEWVVAIGSPYGLDNTVTSGIISNKARTMSEDNPVKFIQTDVPVNPGNSGGPLFNLKGEVIGINSMIYSRTGGFQGLSFAIPIDVAMRIKDRAPREAQSVSPTPSSHGRLGIAIRPVTDDLADDLALPSTRGALVVQVAAGSPAQAAGLMAGDVVVAFNDRAIASPDVLARYVAAQAPGAPCKLVVYRDGEVVTVRTRLS
ncbi:S1C family serine protease [Pandoraea sp. ISTKB]|uniref:S1C family serine protease n=1 Tax=Pandoraea sp. ISTKB TaxID=1586708 RepID=UPI0008463667|nr:trypsin-like peptidase domain-containing protein [Pandoraea sp. ISTKB]ODP32273.1 hypothetical protein A9762_23855 [Pandoraea sp. ISTKB]